MHPAHQNFVSRPVFCSLLDLFELLDQLELRDRHSILTSVYQDLFRTTSIKAPRGMDEDAAIQWLYDRFKEKAVDLSIQMEIHWAFITVGIVTTTLMWLYVTSDEKRIPEVMENNTKDGEAAREQFARIMFFVNAAARPLPCQAVTPVAKASVFPSRLKATL